jgi:hypothetical protein
LCGKYSVLFADSTGCAQSPASSFREARVVRKARHVLSGQYGCTKSSAQLQVEATKFAIASLFAKTYLRHYAFTAEDIFTPLCACLVRHIYAAGIIVPPSCTKARQEMPSQVQLLEIINSPPAIFAYPNSRRRANSAHTLLPAKNMPKPSTTLIEQPIKVRIIFAQSLLQPLSNSHSKCG